MNHRPFLSVAAFALLTAAGLLAQPDARVTSGRLDAVDPEGQALASCPLKHTAVDAEISGTMARVTVTQQFHNPFQRKIEAIYIFPLHQDSAVDDMTMTVGDRLVKGVIRERGEARRIYTEAKARGQVASLLDQERPNIFTQAVANIEPGEQIVITISYSQTMAWKDGRFEFDFPTVVGPRYIPGNPTTPNAAEPGETPMPSLFPATPPRRGAEGEAPVVNPVPAAPTDRVPDAGRITPPVVEEGFRSGHDLSITVRIQAGLPITDLKSALHEIEVEHPAGDPTRAIVRLAEKSVLPNRDFTLTYGSGGDEVTDTILTHTDERGKFFSLVLQPPARVRQDQVVPRELVFVLDTSGSMSGFPMETSKALMRRAIENLRPADRFNLVTFAGTTSVFSKKPLANTEQNRHRALRFIDTLRGGGGTEMMDAINTALGENIDPDKVRIVCFLTDGYVGNDQAIIAAVRNHARTTRVFSFGIGSSVNRFLMDSMARAGRGEAHYVLRHEAAEKSADRFYERIDAPVLTDITLDFGGLAVEEVYPKNFEDLFASRPVVVKGRYTKAGTGAIKLKGRNAAGRYERDLTVTLPETAPENPVLASQWARAKVGHLMMQDMDGLQEGRMKPALKNDIIALGLGYNLLTRFTSFVAVEEQHSTEGGAPRTIQVPVEMPQGVSQSGVFGRPSAPSSAMAKVVASNTTSSMRVAVPETDIPTPSSDFGDGDDFGSGWGSGGGANGGGFGNIPTTMKKRCSKTDRLARLATNGGSPQCEDAVVKTLDWLKQRQRKDGGWAASNRCAATGLALLAYLGHCETPLSEKYGESVLFAITFLVNQGNKNQGRLADDPNDPLWPYEHAIATCALAEACTFSKQLAIQIPGLEDAVRDAGQWIIDHQAQTGAWAAVPGKAGAGSGADLLLTCLNLQALKACKQTGLDFKNLKTCARKGLDQLKTGQEAGAMAFAYQLWGNESAEVPRAACAAIARDFKFQWTAPDADLVALYFNAHAMINRGGKQWSDFNALFLPELLKAQARDGSFTDLGGGSSKPGPFGGQLHGDSALAVHFRTCLAALTLEVYYRFLPGTGAQP
jgi:Ca-activated chloride channel family protein